MFCFLTPLQPRSFVYRQKVTRRSIPVSWSRDSNRSTKNCKTLFEIPHAVLDVFWSSTSTPADCLLCRTLHRTTVHVVSTKASLRGKPGLCRVRRLGTSIASGSQHAYTRRVTGPSRPSSPLFMLVHPLQARHPQCKLGLLPFQASPCLYFVTIF